MKKFKKIFLSLFSIGVVAIVAVAASNAFFSDTETSVGNRFVAGELDLIIDNESYALDWNIPGYEPTPTGAFVRSEHTSWTIEDDTIKKFFDFIDLKPGDYGEDTISIHVQNDAWLCAAAQLTDDNDVDYTTSELNDDETVDQNAPESTDGELDEEINIAFWRDDGDNVFEEGEGDPFLFRGTIAQLDGAKIALADRNHGSPLPGGETSYIGKYWCFGNLRPVPVDGDPNVDDRDPTQGTGFTCNGSQLGNEAQTDIVVGDVQFYAEQARHNENFSCRNWEPKFAPKVGAKLSAYNAPQSCTTTVQTNGSIQEAVNSASANSTICVEDGTYNETVHIGTEGLTLASLNGPTNTATIIGGVIIDAADVTVTGFIVIPGDTEGSLAGFYLKDSADNAEISYNEIDGSSAASNSRGVVNTGGEIDAVLISNNYIHGPNDNTGTGIYTNPHTGSLWTIEYNDIDDYLAGIGQWNGANVMYNEFDHQTASSEAIGVDNAWDANGGSVNYNNFLNDLRLNTYTTIAGTINAENNFWGPNGAAAQIDDTNGTVDYTPEAGSQYPHR